MSENVHSDSKKISLIGISESHLRGMIKISNGRILIAKNASLHADKEDRLDCVDAHNENIPI